MLQNPILSRLSISLEPLDANSLNGAKQKNEKKALVETLN